VTAGLDRLDLGDDAALVGGVLGEADGNEPDGSDAGHAAMISSPAALRILPSR
jgi:hypothetical protein